MAREGMTLRELRELVAKEPPENDTMEIVVWLPGSTIRLSAAGFIRGGALSRHRGKLMIEGNVTPGSALDDAAR